MTPRTILRGLALAVALLAPGLAGAAEPWPPADTDIRRMLSDRVTGGGQGSGMVVALVGPTGRRIIAYGTLAKDDPRPMNGDTVFHVASITKLFTALLLAQMAEHQGLSVDAAVAETLPKPADRLPRTGDFAVSYADLATMTSGLPPWPGNRVSRDGANPFAGYTRAALFGFVASAPRVPRAQRRYVYSDLSYGLLGQALAAHEGQDWPDLVRTRITQPLGLKDTRPDLTDDMHLREAVEYAPSGERAPHRDFAALEGAGALNATANDLASLLEAFLGYRQPGLTAELDRMLVTRRPGGQAPSGEAALGWNVLRAGGRELAWKDGYFHVFVGLDRAAGLGVVVLANGQRPQGVNDLGLHLLDPDLPLAPATETRPSPAGTDRQAPGPANKWP